MKFLDLTTPELMIIDMGAESKEDAFRELANALFREIIILDCDYLITQTMHREELGSTGVGFGVAIAHCQLSEISVTRLAIGTSKNGIEWESLDGAPIHLIFLVLTNPKNVHDILRLNEMLAVPLREANFREGLIQADTTEEAWEILEDCDNGFF